MMPTWPAFSQCIQYFVTKLEAKGDATGLLETLWLFVLVVIDLEALLLVGLEDTLSFFTTTTGGVGGVVDWRV